MHAPQPQAESSVWSWIIYLKNLLDPNNLIVYHVFIILLIKEFGKVMQKWVKQLSYLWWMLYLTCLCAPLFSSEVCGKCGEALSRTQPAVKAMDKLFHSSCFCCMSCHRPLQGMQFYDRDGAPQCEDCYMVRRRRQFWIKLKQLWHF